MSLQNWITLFLAIVGILSPGLSKRSRAYAILIQEVDDLWNTVSALKRANMTSQTTAASTPAQGSASATATTGIVSAAEVPEPGAGETPASPSSE